MAPSFPFRSSAPSFKDSFTLLRDCINEKDIQAGRLLHCASLLHASIPSLAPPFINLFAICGTLLEVNIVFSAFPTPHHDLWHALLSSYAICGEHKNALLLFHKMLKDDPTPCKSILLLALKTCTSLRDLDQGRSIHDHIIVMNTDLGRDVYVGTTLIDMYAKCGDLDKAFRVFENLVDRNVVSWNAMIRGCSDQGHDAVALSLYGTMHVNGIIPSTTTLSIILKACGNLVDSGHGCMVHNYIMERGIESYVYIVSSLINMYVKCGRLEDARGVFNMMQDRNLVAWNAIIDGYAQYGHGISSLELFEDMIGKGLEPDEITFSSALKACCSVNSTISLGRLIHDGVIRRKCESDAFVCNGLIEMYGKNGSLKEAQTLFNRLVRPDSVSYGGLIAGYVQCGDYRCALCLFEHMQEGDLDLMLEKPILFWILKACAGLRTLELGFLLHDKMIKGNFTSDLTLGIGLVEMYAKCGNLGEACIVFHSLSTQETITWNILIEGHIQHGHEMEALELFEKMQQECVKPDEFTLSCILNACGNAKLLNHGRLIHKTFGGEYESDFVIGNSLIDMYSRCGELREARTVFDALEHRTIISWGAMIAGYAEHGSDLCALELFDKMQDEMDLSPDKDIYLFALKACGSAHALEQGRLIHGQIALRAFDSDVSVGNVLIEMYNVCGNLEESLHVFGMMPDKDVSSWGTLISGYALHGDFKLAKKCFQTMRKMGIQPDHSTFTSVLAACSHCGCLNEGYELFECLRQEMGLIPNVEHFNCLIYMLAVTGLTNEAKELLHTMPITPNVTGWVSLLSGCKTHGTNDLGKFCFEKTTKLDDFQKSTLYSMSNILVEPENICMFNVKMEKPSNVSKCVQESKHILQGKLNFSFGYADIYRVHGSYSMNTIDWTR